jgi:solute carrier family 13 (sodium-dependent dicarboxylate transporter), member 2/3/5
MDNDSIQNPNSKSSFIPASLDTKKVIGILLAALLLVIFYYIDPPTGLSENGKNVLGLLLAGLTLWITEAIPVAVTALFMIIMQPVLNVDSLSTAFKSFMSPVIFFVLATFGLSIVIVKTPLAARIANWLIKKAGDRSERVVLAFMVGAAILSAIISNVPVTALFMGLALEVIRSGSKQANTRNLGKALMIGIPFGAMIGGMMTPAGSSINILALYLLKEYTQTSVTFVEWMLFGVPLAVVLLPIAWLILIKLIKPEPLEKGIIKKLGAEIPAGFTKTELKVSAIIILMVGLWVISSWVKDIDITLVAMAGLILFFLPGINLLDWDEFSSGVGWDTILMIGGVTSIGAAVVQTGLGKWFVEQSLLGTVGWGIILLTIAVGTLVNVMHLVLPIAPAIATVVIPPLAELSLAANIHPAVFAVTAAFMAGCSMLLPLDAVPLITYSKRYYSMWDMFKVGSLTSMIWAVLTGLWVPLVVYLIY